MAKQHTGSGNVPSDPLADFGSNELRDGFLLLLRAHTYSLDAGSDIWEFAVEIQQFYDLGLSNNELRWLVAKGFAEHGQETSACGDSRRSFERSCGLTFSPTSALVLTELGADLATQIFEAIRETNAESESQNSGVTRETNGSPSRGNGTGHPQAGLKPKWDARRRELRIGGQLVKRYRVPAASQEAVLSAFEEESWPAYIDDPLPGVADGVPKQRLHNAIKRLNDHQTNCLIHFHGNGNGEGIGWALVSDGRKGKTRQAHRIVNGHASQRG